MFYNLPVFVWRRRKRERERERERVILYLLSSRLVFCHSGCYCQPTIPFFFCIFYLSFGVSRRIEHERVSSYDRNPLSHTVSLKPCCSFRCTMVRCAGWSAYTHTGPVGQHCSKPCCNVRCTMVRCAGWSAYTHTGPVGQHYSITPAVMLGARWCAAGAGEPTHTGPVG